MTLDAQANVSLCKKAPCPRPRNSTNTAMTASQWSHLDAALSFTRIQHPSTGASGLRYRSTRTLLLLRQPWSWPSAFVLTRETGICVVCWMDVASGKVFIPTTTANLFIVAQHQACIWHISSMSRAVVKRHCTRKRRESCKLPHAAADMPLHRHPHPRIYKPSSL